MKLLLLSVATLAVINPSPGFSAQTLRAPNDFSLRTPNASSCGFEGCHCPCDTDDCPPCPGPLRKTCLFVCGVPQCPCFNAENSSQRANGEPNWNENSTPRIYLNGGSRSSRGEISKRPKAYDISTVNRKPYGPICSCFHIRTDVVVTSNLCIAGKPIEDLFVTINIEKGETTTKRSQVLSAKAPPNTDAPVFPVLLYLEAPLVHIQTLKLPRAPVNFNKYYQLHKWQVSEDLKEYNPVQIPMRLHPTLCEETQGEQICTHGSEAFRMGWNDIGTALVEIEGKDKVAQGLYVGVDLYEKTGHHKYLALYPYSKWLLEASHHA